MTVPAALLEIALIIDNRLRSRTLKKKDKQMWLEFKEPNSVGTEFGKSIELSTDDFTETRIRNDMLRMDDEIEEARKLEQLNNEILHDDKTLIQAGELPAKEKKKAEKTQEQKEDDESFSREFKLELFTHSIANSPKLLQLKQQLSQREALNKPLIDEFNRLISRPTLIMKHRFEASPEFFFSLYEIVPVPNGTHRSLSYKISNIHDHSVSDEERKNFECLFTGGGSIRGNGYEGTPGEMYIIDKSTRQKIQASPYQGGNFTVFLQRLRAVEIKQSWVLQQEARKIELTKQIQEHNRWIEHLKKLIRNESEKSHDDIITELSRNKFLDSAFEQDSTAAIRPLSVGTKVTAISSFLEATAPNILGAVKVAAQLPVLAVPLASIGISISAIELVQTIRCLAKVKGKREACLTILTLVSVTCELSATSAWDISNGIIKKEMIDQFQCMDPVLSCARFIVYKYNPSFLGELKSFIFKHMPMMIALCTAIITVVALAGPAGIILSGIGAALAISNVMVKSIKSHKSAEVLKAAIESKKLFVSEDEQTLLQSTLPFLHRTPTAGDFLRFKTAQEILKRKRLILLYEGKDVTADNQLTIARQNPFSGMDMESILKSTMQKDLLTKEGVIESEQLRTFIVFSIWEILKTGKSKGAQCANVLDRINLSPPGNEKESLQQIVNLIAVNKSDA